MLLFSLLPIFYLDLWFSAAKVLWLQMSFIPIHSVRICWPSWILKFAFNQILNSLKTSFLKSFFCSVFTLCLHLWQHLYLLYYLILSYTSLSLCLHVFFSVCGLENPFYSVVFNLCLTHLLIPPFIKAFRSIFSFFMMIHSFKFLNILECIQVTY